MENSIIYFKCFGINSNIDEIPDKVHGFINFWTFLDKIGNLIHEADILSQITNK